MQRTTWGTVYCLVGLGILGAVVLLARSVSIGSEPLAMTGMALCITTLAASRFATDIGWLKSARRKIEADRAEVTQEQMVLNADRAILQNRTQRARREMDDLERQRAEEHAADRESLRTEIAAEREAMLLEVENQRAEIRNAAFTLGHMAGVRGISLDSVEDRSNVIPLPTGLHQSTTMGQGAIYN